MNPKFIFALAIIYFLATTADAAVIIRIPPPKNKKIVLVRPSRPHVKVFKPVNIKNGYVWIEGYWKWNRKIRNYMWIDGHLIKRKRGKSWVNGYWGSFNNGWVYTSGKWA